MTEIVSWQTYGIALSIFTLLYYGVIGALALIARRHQQAEDSHDLKPTPSELSPDQILSTLEETILHAQRKRYHPDEILTALRQKVAELKTISKQ